MNDNRAIECMIKYRYISYVIQTDEQIPLCCWGNTRQFLMWVMSADISVPTILGQEQCGYGHRYPMMLLNSHLTLPFNDGSRNIAINSLRSGCCGLPPLLASLRIGGNLLLSILGNDIINKLTDPNTNTRYGN